MTKWTPPEEGNVRQKLNFDCDSLDRTMYVLACLFSEYDDIWVRKSPSGRGHHIVVDAPHSLLKRIMIGDCYGRVKADCARIKLGLPIGILFHWKGENGKGKQASKWVKIKPIDVRGVNVWLNG